MIRVKKPAGGTLDLNFFNNPSLPTLPAKPLGSLLHSLPITTPWLSEVAPPAGLGLANLIPALPAPPPAAPLGAPPGSRRQRTPQKAERFAIETTRQGRGERWLVITQPAQLRKTKWALGNRCTDRVLSMPGMLFLLHVYRETVSDVYAYFRKSAYTSDHTRLYHSILPNQSDSGWVCLGQPTEKDRLMQRTASEATDWGKVRVVLHHFWRETHFGEHYISRLRNAASLHPSLQSLAAWEAASRRAPNFIQDVPWQPWGTVADFFHGGRR